MRWTISVVVVFGTGCSDHSWLFGCCKVQRIVASYTKSSYISSTRANGRNKISEDQRTKALDHARRTTANTDGRTSDGRERSRLVRDKLLPRNKRTRHREDHRGGTSTRRNARASTERTEEGEQRQRKENQNTHSHVTSRREADAGDSTLFSRRRELRKSTPPLSLEQKQKLVVDLVPRSSSPSDNNCAKTTATARRLVPKDATPTSNINHGEPIQGEISPTSSADHVALTFGLLTGFMLASSIFSFLQAALVPSEWSAVMIVCGTVTMVSGLLYSSMRETWEQVRTIPPVCRYIDWIITVPLQIVEFYLLLRTAMPPKYQVSSTLCIRIMVGASSMLAFGYMGETEVMSIWPAFFASLLCWSYIVWEVFFGQASQLASLLTLEAALRYLKKVANTPETKDFEKPAAAKAFDRLRLILLLGWSLYPLRPVLLRFIWPEIIPTTSSQGTTPESSGIGSEESLNALYNLGDLVNKIFFGIAVWTAAGSEEETTHQQVYRVQRREAEIITSWMEQLRMRNIVHKNFRGTLPAWLDLEDLSFRSAEQLYRILS